MAITYIKKAIRNPQSGSDETTHTVSEMLAALEKGGEDAVREACSRLDHWDGDIVVHPEQIDAALRQLPETVKDDIGFAHARISDFAKHQRDALQEFEVELMDGLVAGQKLVPVKTAGCYVPGGRYAHVASAIMSVATAKVAGVEQVIATSPASGERGGVDPAILYAMDLSGAGHILCAGGVQGIAALAYGLFTGHRADIIVGPGNRFVAEAKRMLFGRVGIDVIAGPTESLVVCDDTADPEIVACDLAGQAEHGVDSPVWLVTTSERVAGEVNRLMPEAIARLPTVARNAAQPAWDDHGEIVLVETREEAVQVCDDYAPEHLHVQAEDLEWWLASLQNYGSLFLGEETTVAFGDKCAGPNHILPTRGAGRYSGGLNVGKFIKTLTYQRMSKNACRAVAPVAARISRLEGMEGHALTADARLEKYSTGQQDQPCVLEIDLSDPGPIPGEAIAEAVNLMRTGRLHRYGEFSGTVPHAALFEQEFAEYIGSRYAVGFNSGGSAIYLGLKVAGVEAGDKVLVNAFNLAPVPGAIHHAGASAVLVEVGNDYLIRLDDLEQKALDSGAKVLLLTHMRGHIADMSCVQALCERLGLILVEDCAHTMGAKWNGTFTGRFGALGCFSTQTFKHINSGEGGILVTDDDEMAAKAILYAGSYMLYDQHRSAPPRKVFERLAPHIPNFSMRMSNLVACILRPQLREIAERGERWNTLYAALEKRLNGIENITVPPRLPEEEFVASSIQFHFNGLDPTQLEAVADRCTARGVAFKWFGRDVAMGYTSQARHWRYLEPQQVPDTAEVLKTTCDMRIPPALTEEDCETIAVILREELNSL
jgi:sulfopropanediol 3-dehydrogenase